MRGDKVMDRQVSISLGVIVARTRHGDDDNAWQANRVMLGDHAISAGHLLRRDRETDYYFAGAADLQLDAAEINSYRNNLENDPRLYLVLARRGDGDGPPLVHLITADPGEAESYLEAAPDDVEEVEMPQALADLISIFIDSHTDDEQDRDWTIAGATVH
jgi:hypothetical protein